MNTRFIKFATQLMEKQSADFKNKANRAATRLALESQLALRDPVRSAVFSALPPSVSLVAASPIANTLQNKEVRRNEIQQIYLDAKKSGLIKTVAKGAIRGGIGGLLAGGSIGYGAAKLKQHMGSQPNVPELTLAGAGTGALIGAASGALTGVLGRNQLRRQSPHDISVVTKNIERNPSGVAGKIVTAPSRIAGYMKSKFRSKR